MSCVGFFSAAEQGFNAQTKRIYTDRAFGSYFDNYLVDVGIDAVD
ncbi:MAG: hypothetical protein ACYSTG_04025 [Planctomycetota bacterium]|jgi:hypothetical protein